MSASSPTQVPGSTRSTPPSTRRTGRPVAGRRVLGVVQVLLVLTALTCGIGGTAVWALGLPAGDGSVVVSVIAGRDAVDEVLPGAAPDDSRMPLYSVPVVVTEDLAGQVVAGAPVHLGAPNESLELAVAGSTLAERALDGGDALLTGLGTAVAALLLRRLVASVAAGAAFAERNARRLVGVAGAVALVSLVAPLAPLASTALVLRRAGLGGPAGPFWPSSVPDVGALLVVGVLLAVAEAFRQAQVAHRANDGLV